MPIILTKKNNKAIASVEDEIRQRLQTGNIDSFLYVVPTNRKVRDLQREFLHHVPAKTSPSFSLFTLETLASRLYSILCPQQRHLAGPSQAVLIKQAIDATENTLQYVRLHGAQRWIPKGTFEKIVNVINKLKETGVYPAQLYDELQNAGEHEKTKLHDILAIYEKYEELMGEDFVDSAGMLKHVNEQWNTERSQSIFRKYFPSTDIIFISGFDEFSNPELTLLHNISEINNIAVIIEFDYQLENEELFGHLKENYKKFLEMGFTHAGSLKSQESDLHKNVSRHLFQYSAQLKKSDSSQWITVLDVADYRGEVETIAKIIKQISQQQPERDLSKICVALYQPQNYTSLFRETFERYGIPVNITDRYSLDQSPFVIAFLALLDVRRNDFRLRDIMRALSSPYFRFIDAGRVVDAGNLYEVAVRLKISRGYSTWIKRIDKELNIITHQLLSTSGDKEEWQLRQDEQELKNAKLDLEYLSGLLQRFRKNITPREFKEHIIALLDELHILECLLAVRSTTISEEQLEKDARAYQKFLSFIDEFLSILSLQKQGDSSESLGFYLEQLRAVLAHVRYNIYQRYGYGVLVTSFEETRGLDFDVMILAGLVDGEFPPIYQPEIFFSDSRRQQQEKYHLTKHRYLFYQAMTNFSEHLYLIYPCKDGDIELVRSSFLDALENIVNVGQWKEQLQKQLADTIFSEDELLLRAGALHVSDEEQREHLPLHLQRTFEHMNHTSSVEQSRSERTSQLEYQGIIFQQLSADAQRKLQEQKERNFSATQLELYGKCPFQYFAERVLRLNVVSEVEEGLTALERGGILHDILFEFYVSRRERELAALSSLNEVEFNNACSELITLANRKIHEYIELDIFSELDKEILLGTKERKGIMRELLEFERQRKLDVEPKFFELAFGYNTGTQRTSDPSIRHEQAIKANTVSLMGRIDRVEIGNDSFTIIDYKTGATLPKRKEIDLGISLQLPLYLHAVETILEEKYNKKFSGTAGIYFSLRSPVHEQLGIGSAEHEGTSFEKKRKSKQLVNTDEELKAIIAQAIQFVNDYVSGIANGNFPVKPKLPQQICENCDFKTVCRIQTQLTLHEQE